MISNHVPSLDLCKKLRDLGWKKETMFYWLLINEEAEESGGSTKYHDIFYCNDYIDDSCDHQAYECSDKIPAPTVGEMLHFMPPKVALFARGGDHFACIDHLQIGKCPQIYRADKENAANPVAEVLIHLLENNLVNLEEKE